jgi:undecaprenyl-diphosphatase
MLLLQALILGVVQGLTEMWPVSSSAHLVLLPWLLKWDSPLLNSLSFDVALHFGTLLALLLYFYDDLWDLARCWGKGLETTERRENRRLGILLVIAVIPGALAGYFFEKQAGSLFRDPSKIALALIGMGALMVCLDLWRPQFREISRFRPLQALLTGCFQALAIFPGVSRSGATLTSLRLLGFQRPDAARLSFLMALPLVGGACLLEGRHLWKGGIPQGEALPLIVGVFAAALSGFLVIKYFMKFLRSHTLLGFGIYRFILGGLVLAVVALRS